MLWLPGRRRGELTGPCGSPYELGKAADFNGTTGFLERADVSTLNCVNNQLAGNLWLWLDSKAATSAIVGKYDNSAGLSNEWVLYYHQPADRLRLDVYSNASGFGSSANTFGSPPINTWINVWFWFTAADVNISINDGAVDSASAVAPKRTSQQPMRFGRTADNAWPLNGRVDASGFWLDGVPAASERTSIYNAGNGKDFASLTAAEKVRLITWLEMGELTGVTPYCDFQGSNNFVATNMSQAAGKT